jgi:hypothetical protein
LSLSEPRADIGLLAARLVAVIDAHAGARVDQDTLVEAAHAADLGLAGSPDARRTIRAALDELVAAGLIVLPRGATQWDVAFAPPLPRWVGRAPRRPAKRTEPARTTWHASLGWAAAGARSGTWSDDQLRVLRAVNDFIRAGGPVRAVPLAERSLELTGDEKLLGRILGGPLFAPGRLSLALLGATRAPTPFIWERVGPGSRVLVVENWATFVSVRASLPADHGIGVLAFGFGRGFVTSVEFIGELASAADLPSPVTAVRYFGDLDKAGIEIPRAAEARALELSLPPVRPAVSLWRLLLARGKSSPAEPVATEVADQLAAWFPPALRDEVAEHLAAGRRLAQEAVGSDLLATADRTWASAGGLAGLALTATGASGSLVGLAGALVDTAAASSAAPAGALAASPHVTPLAAVAPMPVQGSPTPTPAPPARGRRPSGMDALTCNDDWTIRLPEEEGWTDWVAASRTRNFLLEDPLLDWLREFGRDHSFVPDDERGGYEPRTDFRRFVLEQGLAFEAGVMRCLVERAEVVTIARSGADSRSRDLAAATVEAMRGGAEMIAQAVLRDAARRTYGVADLLVRSDVLARLFPDAIPEAEVPIGAPGIGAARHHYRVVDIKFHSFDLRRDGSVGGGTHATPFAAQTWLYTMAAGRIQGFTPDAAYLLGRTWLQGDERGVGCLERIARVDMGRLFPDRDASLGELAEAAVGWIRTMRREGRDWQATPVPSRPELFPHMRFVEDAP